MWYKHKYMAVKKGDLVVVGNYEGIARVVEIQSYEKGVNGKIRFILIAYLYGISPSGLLIQCCQDYQVKKIGKVFEDKIKNKFKRLQGINMSEEEKSIKQIDNDYHLLMFLDIPKNTTNFRKYLVNNF